MFGFIGLWLCLWCTKTDCESKELVAIVCTVGKPFVATCAYASQKYSVVCLYRFFFFN